MMVEGPDGQRFEFPDGTSQDVIDHELTYHYNPQKPNLEGKASRELPGLQGATGTTEDVTKSVLQGARNVGEALIAAPGIADDVENAAVKWLKSQGNESWLGRLGSNWEAIANTLHANDIPFPNYRDVQFLEQQAGAPPQYTPQTPAGQLAYGGTIAGLGGALVGPPAVGMAGRVLANPYGQALVKGGLQGAGILGGGGGLYKLYQHLTNP